MNNTSNNFSRWEYQNIALAAVAQGAISVDSLARQGHAVDKDIIACLNPLLVFNPETEADIYPDVGRFSPGLGVLQDVFRNEKLKENADVLRYILGMLLLIAPTTMLGGTLVEGTQTLAARMDGEHLAIPTPPEAVRGWPLVGGAVYDLWSQAAENLMSVLAPIRPQLVRSRTQSTAQPIRWASADRRVACSPWISTRARAATPTRPRWRPPAPTW